MKLTCNGKTVNYGDNTILTILPSNGMVYGFVNGNDLFDLGFSHTDLTNHNLIVEENGSTIVFICQKENQERLVRDFMHEMKVSENAATFMLRKHKFNYGMAKLYLDIQRTEKPNSKPCGEIVLPGPSEECNLKPAKAEDFLGVLRSLFPVKPVEPMFAKDMASFDKLMPKSPECQCQNGMVGTQDCLVHGENPCFEIKTPKLNMECVCKEVGKAHCRLHSPLIEHGGSD